MAGTPCKLQAINGPDCDFQATAGDSVTLQILEVDGGGFIDFDVVKYAGQVIPGTPTKSITFTVIAGSNSLELVYLFSRPDDGHGELQEGCSGNPFLAFIRAANKAVSFTVCA